MTWQTFWLDQTDRETRGLRRYTTASGLDAGQTPDCSTGYHTAITWLPGDYWAASREDGLHYSAWSDEPLAHDDEQWPTVCEKGCGYQFTEEDHFQKWTDRVWKRSDSDALVILHQTLVHPDFETAGAGAMWDASWMGRFGPDGICLMVRCPRGDGTPGWMNDWPVDMPASNGAPWSRTGDPRQCNVTASPSIAIGDPAQPGYYHGYLQNGVLTDHIG